MGDQAMLEAFLLSANAPVTVLASPHATFLQVEGASYEVEVIPGLYGGRSRKHSMERIVSLIDQHATMTAIGADIVDGGYHGKVAAELWSICGVASARGVPSRVVSMSWREGVEPWVRDAAALAISNGVRAFVRDPHSYARFRKDGLNGTLAADIAFTLPYRPPASTKRSPRVLLNTSGLIHTSRDLTTEYRRLVAGLVARGRSVTVVPHVTSQHASDVDAIRSLEKAFAGTGLARFVTTIQAPPRPAEAVALASSFELVITGRMHLAVLSCLSSTPTIMLATHGKVSGLAEMLGQPGWCIDPWGEVAESVLEQVDDYLADPQSTSAGLRSALANIRTEARINFDGMFPLQNLSTPE